MSEKTGIDDEPWPMWSAPATKGDVIRAAVYIQQMVGALANAQLAFSNDEDRENVKELLSKYLTSSQKLQEVIGEIGGEKRGDG